MLLLAAGEFWARAFVHVQGVDKTLFAHPHDGIAYFHRLNADGIIAFGEPTYTDAEGFRISPYYQYPSHRPAVLFIGDSVTFGVGVKEEDSFVGRLRRARPDLRVYNAGVLGFNTAHYFQTASYFLEHLSDIREVVVVVVLNDLDDISSRDIRDYLKHDQAQDMEQADKVSWLARINATLRAKSALFVWLKAAIYDASATYYAKDTAAFNESARFQAGMGFIEALAAKAARHHVALTVVMLPYEYQLRTPSLPREPQAQMAEYFRTHHLSFFDAYACMAGKVTSRTLYLYGDHIHLSPQGHALIAECMAPLMLDKEGSAY